VGDFRYSETPIRTLIELGRAIRLKRKATGSLGAVSIPDRECGRAWEEHVLFL
jgi:hypothetical protein